MTENAKDKQQRPCNLVPKKYWTEKEKAFLEKYHDVMTTTQIAQALGRTAPSVKCRLKRSRVHGYRVCTADMTVNNISKLVGVNYVTIMGKWRDRGLKLTRKSVYWTISQDDLLKFLKKNPDLWNAAKVTNTAIFANKKWFFEKQAADRKKPARHWTNMELATLKAMYAKGATLEEIADKLGKTKASVRMKLSYERDKGWHI